MDLAKALEFAAAERAAATQAEAIKPGNYALVPAGFQVRVFGENEANLPAPLRKRAKVRLQSPASLIDYWSLYHTESSRIFADQEKLTFLAVIDYHGIGEAPAGWREHTAKLALTVAPEWATWKASNGKRMNQEEFARFIEDNTPDIIQPSAADMLEISRDMTAKKDVEFSGGARLANGQHRISYTENTTATVGKGQMEVPESFKIRIPAYVGFPPVEVTARLRYRIDSGKLALWYDLLRPHKVEETVFAEALKVIEAQCGATVLIGAVE